MARYIDEDLLIKKMFPLGIGDGMYVINAKAVKFAIDNTPTADVVPKSEVEQLQHKYDLAVAEREANVKGFAEQISKANSEIERLEKALKNSLPSYYQACSEEEAIKIGKEYGKTEGAIEVIEYLEKEGLLNMTPQGIAELKKTYTEEKKDED